MGKVKAGEEPQSGRPVTIGRAAAAAGLSPKAVRLYETRGLLPPPARNAAGYRLYTDTDVGRMRFIAAARRLGLHMNQITEILATSRTGQRPCATTRAILDQRISEIDKIVSQLTNLRGSLVTARDTNTEQAEGKGAICPVIENDSLC